VNATKPKLLYIASNGRSGSTVLEMLLNVSPHMWTLGEFHVLPWEIRRNVKPCGCGARVMDCELWGPVIAEHQETLVRGSIDRFRRGYNVDRTLRFKELPELLSGRLRENAAKMADVRRYANHNRVVCEAVERRAKQLGKTQLTWLVDSSKSPYRLMWLAASDQFELRVIHLIKDPRAFAYSVAKHTSGLFQAYRVARAVARWQVENRLFDALTRHYLRPEQVFRLQYEQLANDPDDSLRRIAVWIGLPAWTCAAASFREANHGISGNPARFDTSGIQLDEQWKRGLSPSLQRLAFRCGWQLASRYGYHNTYA